ncbi:Hypothetical predicted protein [Paramuricea clavata]|uniref:Uncharacterized protein n=1 Tax=Paramuricea clavata TaxID=317549 RepID=A0A6S7HPY8_PARCT|nr:Hypothetical predicted protein [Paramuricea clavata]
MVKSRAELFAEINVTPPAKDSDNESVEGKEDMPERETKVVGNIPLPTTASTPATKENLHPTIPSTPNASNNLPGRVNTISEDLAPLTTTPNFSNTLCGVQNIALGGITNASQDLIVPLTSDVSNCTLLDLDSIVSEDLAPLTTTPSIAPGGITNASEDLIVPSTPNASNCTLSDLDSIVPDPLLYPSSSNNPFPFKQDRSDPRIDEIMNNQKMIMSSLNSLTGHVKQLIQQQHTNIPLCHNEIVGDGGQVVATVGTSYQESEEDNDILPSTVPENSATDMPLSQPPPSSDLVSNDKLAAIKLKALAQQLSPVFCSEIYSLWTK